MVDWASLLNKHFVETLLPNIAMLLIGIVGYVGIGAAYFYVKRRREGEPISPRLLLADVFPLESYQHYSSRVDRWNFIPAVLLFAPLAAFFSTVVGLLLGLDIAAALVGAFGPHAPIASAPWVIVLLQVSAYMLGHEFGQYAGHYALHRVPLLWAIHRAHHSAETLNFFTNPRAHPLELIILIGLRVAFGSLLVGMIYYLTGSTLMPGTTMALLFYNFVFLGSYTMLTHSHIPISFGGRFNIIIGGPVMHQIHHSAEIKHRDKNIGGAPTYIFDWLFGTLYIPQKGETFVVGLNEEEYGEKNPFRTVKDFYFEPFNHGVRHIRSSWRRKTADASEKHLSPIK